MFRFMRKWHNKRKVLAKSPYKSPFQSITGSKAIDWNFQSVKYLGELVQQYGGGKRWVEKQNSKKNSKRMSMPAAWREFCGFLIGVPVRI